MTAPAFAELCARSNFSLLDGASHPAELVSKGADLGLAGISICDTNTLAGVVQAHVAAKELGLPFAVGARVLVDDGAEYLVWPTDRAAYGRLTALLSRGRMLAPKGECRISRADLIGAVQGSAVALLAPDAASAEFGARLSADAEALRDRLPLPLHCAVPCSMDGGLDRRLDCASASGVPLLATTAPRYHEASRRRLADVLTAVRLRTTVDRIGRAAEINSERRLKSPEEIAKLFYRHPEALTASLRILEATRSFSLDQLRYEYPEEVLEPRRTAQETLVARIAEAVAERWPHGVSDDITRRLDHELQLIEQLGYAPYFLTVHEIVRFARSKGILCQGRGSAANSAVCYVLGITAVDPAKHDLLFERFVSASRGEPPDIDVDFEHERREEVIQHIYDRYGRDRAAIVATVIRYRTRSAIREVGKAMGLSEDVTGKLAKSAWGPGSDEPLEDIASSAGLDTSDPRLGMALELAEEIQNFPRHLATHVGGFVITRGPLVELAVVSNAAMEGRTVLEWDKDDVEALGILKVDVLGLGMLSCLRRGFDLLRNHRHVALDLASVPKDDPATYAMLRRADSLGVFQVESRAQMAMLPRLRPREFYDLVVQVAIVRPGPIQGDMVHPYIRRRWGLEEPEYPGPSPEHGPADELKQVLGRTLGVPLFQEQAMRLAIVAAQFSPEEADALRRAMATFKYTQGVGAYRERLVSGMVRRGYSEEMAERVFKQIEGFGSYGFPESHAASFAHLVYASSWLKCHHPAVFACALLNSQPMGFYAPAQIVRDAREHDVVVRPVSVDASAWDCSLEPDPASADQHALRLGLRMVAGLPEEEGRALVKARVANNGAPFASVEEVARRAGLSRRAIEALADADAFAALGSGRREAAWDAAAIDRGLTTDLPLFAAVAAADHPEVRSLIPEPAPTLPAMPEGEAIGRDYSATGLTLRRHPLALLRPILARLRCDDTRTLARAPAGRRVHVPGLVLMRQQPMTAKGVIFMTIEDEHGHGNIVVYTHIAERDRIPLLTSRLIVVEGRVEREDQHAEVPIIHLIASRLIDRSDLLRQLMAMGNDDTADLEAVSHMKIPATRDFR
ncbi:error-prone DNA polymerase [Neoroseomonas oryzicola]|uniref:Error-prone DNA polymerase n=1 Tax=Neoroseomonas oryzicola TaxID=535904 RepID=A0A9X9WDF8_9PROT|nr:error-prone DNA polymerase [Neoroseomonas oryzicola]MBR0658368.1 DNA polymerase III subunit alpha [Neoroseomonas oryzicola]NKE18533.1 error-prone DNA polymerase [Neoroseomonas oryzicola]